MARDFARKFYKSKEWEAARSYALMRDGYLCQICGRPAEEVHHIRHLTPANIWDPSVTLNPTNLMSLCRDCHMRQHAEDRAAGHAARCGKNILPKIVWSDAGEPIAVPPVIETR